MPAIQITAKLAGELAELDASLTMQQADDIRRLLMTNRVKGSSPIRGFQWDAIMPQAQRTLSDAQLAVLDAYRAHDEYNQAFRRALRNAPANSASTAGGGK